MKVVAAVVGYERDLLHPFAIGTSHGSARDLLRMLKDEYEFHANEIAKEEGFLVSTGDELIFVDRNRAMEIAKEANQLKSGYSADLRLMSYMLVSFPREEYQKGLELSEKICKEFSLKWVSGEQIR